VQEFGTVEGLDVMGEADKRIVAGLQQREVGRAGPKREEHREQHDHHERQKAWRGHEQAEPPVASLDRGHEHPWAET
jgi:hypothetical protein